MFKDLAERIYKANFQNKTGNSRVRNNPKLTIETPDLKNNNSSSKKKK